jgi:hypothetical protein
MVLVLQGGDFWTEGNTGAVDRVRGDTRTSQVRAGVRLPDVRGERAGSLVRRL